MLATLRQTAELADFFRSKGVRQVYGKGDFISQPGKPLNGVFYISKGLVKAYTVTKYSEENLLIIRKHDEIFPLIWALTRQDSSIADHVTYQALVETEVWQIDREEFMQFVEQNINALTAVLDMTVEQYRLHSERIINLEYRSVRERIISFLVTMSDRFGRKADGGLLIDVPLRHQDIASSVNATRETASRELSNLERKGWISTKQSYITIKDMHELKKHLSSRSHE